MYSKLGNSLGMQEFFQGVRLEHSANYLSISGTSLRFWQRVINSWLCMDSPHNLWQVCSSKTSCIKCKGAAPTSPHLPRAPPLKAFAGQELSLAVGAWAESLSNTKCLRLGARRLQGVSVQGDRQRGLPVTQVS